MGKLENLESLALEVCHVAREAGGVITDFYGSSSYLEGHHIVAANAALHRPLLEILQEALPLGM